MLVWTPEMLWESASRLLTATILSLKEKAVNLLKNTIYSGVKNRDQQPIITILLSVAKVLLTTDLGYINSQQNHDVFTKVEAMTT